MNDEPPRKILTIERIVLKDLSFETPMGPDAFTKDWQPDFDISLSHSETRLARGRWEVVITATVTAQLEDHVAFLLEVQQAGIFTITGARNRKFLHRALMVDAAKLIFPYLRETIESVAVKGGFKSIGLQPPAFEDWYEDANRPEASSGGE